MLDEFFLRWIEAVTWNTTMMLEIKMQLYSGWLRYTYRLKMRRKLRPQILVCTFVCNNTCS